MRGNRTVRWGFRVVLENSREAKTYFVSEMPEPSVVCHSGSGVSPVYVNSSSVERFDDNVNSNPLSVQRPTNAYEYFKIFFFCKNL